LRKKNILQQLFKLDLILSSYILVIPFGATSREHGRGEEMVYLLLLDFAASYCIEERDQGALCMAG
jgi:hypothetical protein